MAAKLVDHLQAVGYFKMYSWAMYKSFEAEREFERTPSSLINDILRAVRIHCPRTPLIKTV